MSFSHYLVEKMIRKGKVLYDSADEYKYQEKREAEVKQVQKTPLPKNVKFESGKLAGVTVEIISKKENPKDCVIYYIHGGGFVYGEPKTRRFFTGYMANKMGYNVIAVDYRRAPEYPFPAAPDDCLKVYEEILKTYAADHVMFVGESAGGNLVLSTLLQVKDKGLGFPAVVFALSPTVQYDKTFPSYTENLDKDCMIGYLSAEVCDRYLQSYDKKVLNNPYAAPYYGDYTGCPPIFIWASKTEVLRDDSIFLYKKLADIGQPCELYLRDKMMHGYVGTPYFPEAKRDLKIMKQRMDEVMSGKKNFANRLVELKW